MNTIDIDSDITISAEEISMLAMAFLEPIDIANLQLANASLIDANIGDV